jgi:RNA polymerase sigma factor (sigma-70 family)
MLNKNPTRAAANIPQLFRLFKEGDGVAFRSFYDLYHRPLYVFILNLLHNDTIAEEITDDVFVLLWNDRDRINDPRHLISFLYLVARRQTIAHLVKLKKQAGLEAAWAKYSYEWATQFDEVELARDKVLSLILQHVDNLPPKQKEVFLLSFSRRMDVRSIAEELGTSEKNVYKHLSKAYQYFKNLLQPG